MQIKREEPMHGPGEVAGTFHRRDALKAVAMFAAAPLAAQTCSVARSGAAVENRREQIFDDGWRFLRGDAPGAESPRFDDDAWRVLDLPHDFSVEDLPHRAADANGEGTLWGTAVLPTRVGPFDTELSAGGRDTGWFLAALAGTANASPRLPCRPAPRWRSCSTAST